MMVMIGIDPHKRSHTAVAIDSEDVERATIEVRASARQVAEPECACGRAADECCRSPALSVPDGEACRAGRCLRGDLDVPDVSHARAVMAPRQHLLDEWRGPFEYCLDGPVGEIAHRTGDAEDRRLATARLTESHSLYEPDDPHAATDRLAWRRHAERFLPVGFLESPP